MFVCRHMANMRDHFSLDAVKTIMDRAALLHHAIKFLRDGEPDQGLVNHNMADR